MDSEDIRTKAMVFLSDYVKANRKKNLNVLNRIIFNKAGQKYCEFTEDQLQDIYVWMAERPELICSFMERHSSLDKLFNSISYNYFTMVNVTQNLKHLNTEYEIEPDLIEYFEDEFQWESRSLNPNIPLEERLEYHRTALEQLHSWLLDNPQSRLNEALEMVKKTKPSAYKCSLNYVATPSYRFLHENRDTLGLKNVLHSLEVLKSACSKVYGKQIVKNSIVPWKIK